MGAVSVQLKDLLVRLDQQQQSLLHSLGDQQKSLVNAISMSNTTTQRLLKKVVKDLQDDNAAQHVATRLHETAEHDKTRYSVKQDVDHVTQELQRSRELHDFLHSLYFEGIERRQEAIKPRHRKTCEWIFNPTNPSEQRWHSFPDWLKDDHPIYWVVGKAGSGKSTLMSFLVQDERIKAAFSDPGPPVIFLKFFFWEEGVGLQKNRTGLLRSLLWQLFKRVGDSPAVNLLDQVKDIVSNPQLEWTQERLLMILRRALPCIKQRLCLFLDGLDEFEDTENDFSPLLEVIDIFRGLQNVKICISSRPFLLLEDHFEGCPRLQLQDFTKRDITTYVHDSLMERIAKSYSIGKDSLRAHSLVSTTVEKAEGVFLWVRLAVNSLIQGIVREDSLDNLEQRIERMPHGIYRLYNHMWKRMEVDQPNDPSEAATYMQLVLHFGPKELSLIELAIASDKKLQDAYLLNSSWQQPGFVHNLGEQLDKGRPARRVMACCAGFLEIHDRDFRLLDIYGPFPDLQENSPLAREPHLIERLKALKDIHETKCVSLIHKSAGEFFRHGDGKAFLDANPLSKLDTQLSRFRALEVRLLLLSVTPTREHLSRELGYIFSPGDSIWRLTPNFLSNLERVFEVLRSVYLVDFSGWPHIESLNAVDYALAFMVFNVPEYTSYKLDRSGMARSQKDLDSCLFAAIYYLGSALDEIGAIVRPYPCVDIYTDTNTNLEVLLRSGADPNAEMDSRHTGLRTPWLFFLGTIFQWAHRRHFPWRRTVEAFLLAGADPNALCEVRLERYAITLHLDATVWASHQAVLRSQDCIYLRLAVLDMVLISHIGSEVQDLLLNAAAQSSYASVVVYHPSASWFVLSDEVSKRHDPGVKTGLSRIVTSFGCEVDRDSSPSWSSYNFESTARISESPHIQKAGYGNRDDAFIAAGWPKDSIARMRAYEDDNLLSVDDSVSSQSLTIAYRR